MNINGAKIYFTIPILGGIPVTQTALSSFVVMLLLCIVGYRLGRNLKKRPGPSQVLTEKAVSMLYRLVSETMGSHNAHWAPYIGTVFLSSLLGSLIGMTGVLRSTTADLSTTLTWALMTSVLIWYHSIKNNGFLGWLQGIYGADCRDDADEHCLRNCPAHLHGLPSFRQCSRRQCDHFHALYGAIRSIFRPIKSHCIQRALPSVLC